MLLSFIHAKVGGKPIWAQLWFYGVIFAILLVVGTVVQMTAKRKTQEQIFSYAEECCHPWVFYLSSYPKSCLISNASKTSAIGDWYSFSNRRKRTGSSLTIFGAGIKTLLRLFKSIYSSNTVLQSLPDPPLTPQVVRKEQAVALQIFQIIENVNEFVTQDPLGWSNPDMQTWLTAFRESFGYMADSTGSIQTV